MKDGAQQNIEARKSMWSLLRNFRPHLLVISVVDTKPLWMLKAYKLIKFCLRRGPHNILFIRPLQYDSLFPLSSESLVHAGGRFIIHYSLSLYVLERQQH